MANITLDLPDAELARFVAAFAPDYSATLPDGVTPNPLTRRQTATANAAAMLIRHARQVEADAAVTAALSGVTDLALS